MHTIRQKKPTKENTEVLVGNWVRILEFISELQNEEQQNLNCDVLNLQKKQSKFVQILLSILSKRTQDDIEKDTFKN